MTERRRCGWCRQILVPRKGPGRPRRFCSQACRQWDWVSRQRSRELELSENELVIARDHLDALQDEVYALSCAVDDARADLAAAGKRPTVQELTDIINWLLDAAAPVCDRRLAASPGSSAAGDG